MAIETTEKLRCPRNMHTKVEMLFDDPKTIVGQFGASYLFSVRVKEAPEMIKHLVGLQTSMFVSQKTGWVKDLLKYKKGDIVDIFPTEEFKNGKTITKYFLTKVGENAEAKGEQSNEPRNDQPTSRPTSAITDF